jgi:predicted TIM-barrel fold metal-dependent hydrolase
VQAHGVTYAASIPFREDAMVSRRDFVFAGVAAAGLSNAGFSFAKASQPSTKVNFQIPPGACDCHTHIHDPAVPFFAGRAYTPEDALPAEMASLHKALGIQRVVIVTPSVYGTDNSATIIGMKARGNDARGVAVIGDKTTDAELDDLARLGFKGIRLNLTRGGTNDPDLGRKLLAAAIERVKSRKWHIQMYTNLAMITAIKETVAAAPVPVVFDHFGDADPELGVQQPGFANLVDLVRSGKAYVKISVVAGPRPDYSVFKPLAQALIAANVDRILWGTNWPHPNSTSTGGRKPTEVTPLWQVDDGLVLNQLPVWAPDAAIRRKILVDNPARLYEF